MVKLFPERMQRVVAQKHSGDFEVFSDSGINALDYEDVPVIGPWTDNRLGEISSSGSPIFMKISGIGSPDIRGDYYASGIKDGQNVYSSGVYKIFFNDNTDSFYIYTDTYVPVGNYWVKPVPEGSYDYTGNYVAVGAQVSGTLTISQHAENIITTRSQLMFAGTQNLILS